MATNDTTNNDSLAAERSSGTFQNPRDTSALTRVKLLKNIYGCKGTYEFLDEEFNHFLPKNYDTEEFFRLYDSLFYEIPKEGEHSHTTIIDKSIEYSGFPTYDQLEVIDDLKEQIENLKWDIDQVEEEHPLIPNGNIIQNRNDSNLNYYMESGRKRPINNNSVFKELLFRSGYKESDQDKFVVYLNTNAIAGIVSGPPINSQDDLKMDIAEINRFEGETTVPYYG